MPEITMPRLSDSMEEGTIVRWTVADGETVTVGAEIAEIETDKATMEFQSEYAGVLHIGAVEGTTLAVGAVIAQVIAAGEEPTGGSAKVTAPAAVAVNGGTASAVARPSMVGAPSVGAAATGAPAAGAGETPTAAANGRRVSASPVARRLAEGLSIDLRSLVGSGPSGRIVKRDVLAAADNGAAATPGAHGVPSAPATSGKPPAPDEVDRDLTWPVDVPGPAGRRASPSEVPTTTVASPSSLGAPAGAGGKGEIATQETTRIQATIARRMSEAKSTMPEFTLEVDVDMDAAVAMRDEIKALEVDVVPSFNDFVIRACALALRRHPRANGSYRDGRFELYGRVNVGVAVAAPNALVVPTIQDADGCSLVEIARETRRLAAAAREGRLTAAELAGGTFSISNLGMFGITRFTAVLNPPQAAILAVGALEQRPVVRDGEIVVARRMPMTLTCDHRILYGADAAQFLSEIRANLEAPLRLAL